MSTDLDAIIDFLAEVGISVREGVPPAGSFLPGVAIACGGLIFDRDRLRWPGDLLHEAGHVAVTPRALRGSLEGTLNTEDAIENAGEVEAIAWSWAALQHLGLAPEVLFHPEGYRGRAAGLLLSYSLGVCPGAFGLAQAGMTLLGASAHQAGLPPYPHMTRWLRE